MKAIIILCVLLLAACSSLPEGVKPVSGFDFDKYQGTWYEIARLDHSFERGLEKVTANYSRNEDGSVRVINKGFALEKGKWKEAEGKAKFAASPDVGHFKVSFFGPFYGPYVIFKLDENYQYAYVSSSKNTLWLLARSPDVSEQVKQDFLSSSKSLGYDTDALIFVNHE